MGKDQELLEAARTGNVALVEKLLAGRKGGLLGSGSGPIPLSNLLSIWRGPNINCTDSSGYTALHHAALNGHKDIVIKLLQYEASTNVADNKGYFPIHLAAWKGDVEIVKILIHHGPSHSRVNEQNNENETALHCAAQYGHSEVVAVLLEELTDPTIRNNKLETPLDLAALYGRLRVVKMIINAYPNLMSCNTRKHTPLHLAARNGHKAVVQVLLEAGMDVSCQDTISFCHVFQHFLVNHLIYFPSSILFFCFTSSPFYYVDELELFVSWVYFYYSIWICFILNFLLPNDANYLCLWWEFAT